MAFNSIDEIETKYSGDNGNTTVTEILEELKEYKEYLDHAVKDAKAHILRGNFKADDVLSYLNDAQDRVLGNQNILDKLMNESPEVMKDCMEAMKLQTEIARKSIEYKILGQNKLDQTEKSKLETGLKNNEKNDQRLTDISDKVEAIQKAQKDVTPSTRLANIDTALDKVKRFKVIKEKSEKVIDGTIVKDINDLKDNKIYDEKDAVDDINDEYTKKANLIKEIGSKEFTRFNLNDKLNQLSILDPSNPIEKTKIDEIRKQVQNYCYKMEQFDKMKDVSGKKVVAGIELDLVSKFTNVDWNTRNGIDNFIKEIKTEMTNSDPNESKRRALLFNPTSNRKEMGKIIKATMDANVAWKDAKIKSETAILKELLTDEEYKKVINRDPDADDIIKKLEYSLADIDTLTKKGITVDNVDKKINDLQTRRDDIKEKIDKVNGLNSKAFEVVDASGNKVSVELDEEIVNRDDLTDDKLNELYDKVFEKGASDDEDVRKQYDAVESKALTEITANGHEKPKYGLFGAIYHGFRKAFFKIPTPKEKWNKMMEDAIKNEIKNGIESNIDIIEDVKGVRKEGQEGWADKLKVELKDEISQGKKLDKVTDEKVQKSQVNSEFDR